MIERKLRDEEELIEVAPMPKMPMSKIVKTVDGNYSQMDQEGFDFNLLNDLKPYIEGEPLPEPVIKTNRRGERFLRKPGEPRFYFNRNEMIKVYRGIGGKKRSLFWLYNEKKQLHKKIRSELRKKGIPGA